MAHNAHCGAIVSTKAGSVGNVSYPGHQSTVIGLVDFRDMAAMWSLGAKDNECDRDTCPNAGIKSYAKATQTGLIAQRSI